MSFRIQRLNPEQVAELRALNTLFAQAFDETETYAAAPPSDSYLRDQLKKPDLFVLTAHREAVLVGGLVAYLLPKLEQERAELYLYDLAVAKAYRRQGIATALVEALKPLAQAAGAWVIFVQADQDDLPARALYESLGLPEAVLHYDIQPGATA